MEKMTKLKISVKLDKDLGTITVTDNGIGMTADELQKYICSIALSGALDFIEKYEDGDASNGIIGHFGLGFYSSFMVSDTVEVDTLSYIGGQAVHFICSENGQYEISNSDSSVDLRRRGKSAGQFRQPSGVRRASGGDTGNL